MREANICVPDRFENVAISTFQISVRLTNVLNGLGVFFFGDLKSLTYDRIAGSRNCGRKTILELVNLVASLEGGKSKSFTDSFSSKKTEILGLGSFGTIFIPDDVRGWKLSKTPIAPRLENVLTKSGCVCLGDLHKRSYKELREYKGLGKKSLIELREFVSQIQSEKFSVQVSDFNLLFFKFCKQIDRFIDGLGDKKRQIILSRLNVKSNPPTLAELGTKLKCTRERIRQIESEVIRRMLRTCDPWATQVFKEIKRKFAESLCPITEHTCKKWLKSNIQNLNYKPAFYLNAIGHMRRDIPTWNEIQTDRALSKRENDETLNAVRAYVERKFGPVKACDVFDKVKSDLPHITADDFTRLLIGQNKMIVRIRDLNNLFVYPPKKSPRDVAHRILRTSDHSLSAKEIILLSLNLRTPYHITISNHSLHSLLNKEEDIFLLGPKKFGFLNHIRTSKRKLNKIRDDFHKYLIDENRAISSTEIVSERRFDWADRLNAHELAAILKRDNRLSYLGKFLFAAEKWGVEDRKHIKVLIPEVLKKVNVPMTAREIYLKIREIRSLSPYNISQQVKKNPQIRSEGYGYYSLRKWPKFSPKFFIDNLDLLDRVIRKLEPPISFGDLCAVFRVESNGALSRRLWVNIQGLDTVILDSDNEENSSFVFHSKWSLHTLILGLLRMSEDPMRFYEIQWKLRDIFGFSGRAIKKKEIQKVLNRSPSIIKQNDGKFILLECIDDLNIDREEIYSFARDILKASKALLSTSDVLETIHTKTTDNENLSVGLLSSILRDRQEFEAVGTNFFRLKS